MKNLFNNKANVSVKEALTDVFGFYGKAFMAGISVVSAITLIKDAVKANENLKEKYNV